MATRIPFAPADGNLRTVLSILQHAVIYLFGIMQNAEPQAAAQLFSFFGTVFDCTFGALEYRLVALLSAPRAFQRFFLPFSRIPASGD